MIKAERFINKQKEKTMNRTKRRTNGEKTEILNYADKHTMAAAADKYGVSISSIHNWRTGKAYKGMKETTQVGSKTESHQNPGPTEVKLSELTQRLNLMVEHQMKLSNSLDQHRTLNKALVQFLSQLN
jgi:transposase